MTTATAESPPIAAPPSATTSHWRKHRWTTAEYDALLNGGYLVEGSKTFLWDGEIVEPMPENLPHANAQDNLQHLLIERLPRDHWTIRPAHPLALRDGYKPQPDLVVLAGPLAKYRNRMPIGTDTVLTVEIADSSYTDDATIKLPEYAIAGIPQYWIVHLRARRIEVYTNPKTEAGVGLYMKREDYAMDATVPLILNLVGNTQDMGRVAVLDVLRDSLDETVTA